MLIVCVFKSQNSPFLVHQNVKWLSVTEIVLYFMAKCKGTDTNQLLQTIVKWQAFILLTQLDKK